MSTSKVVLKQQGPNGIGGWTLQVDDWEVPSVVGLRFETRVGELARLVIETYASPAEIEAWPVEVVVESKKVTNGDATEMGDESRRYV